MVGGRFDAAVVASAADDAGEKRSSSFASWCRGRRAAVARPSCAPILMLAC